jgi:hypothetical protein
MSKRSKRPRTRGKKVHPLNKLDEFLNISKGVTREVIALHKTEHLPLLKSKLADHGITLNEDTSIPKADRPKWTILAREAGLPPQWWMTEDDPDDFIPTL